MRTTQAGDSSAFVQATSVLMSNHKKLRALGESGRLAYRRRYDWPVTVKRLLAALETVSA